MTPKGLLLTPTHRHCPSAAGHLAREGMLQEAFEHDLHDTAGAKGLQSHTRSLLLELASAHIAMPTTTTTTTPPAAAAAAAATPSAAATLAQLIRGSLEHALAHEGQELDWAHVQQLMRLLGDACCREFNAVAATQAAGVSSAAQGASTASQPMLGTALDLLAQAVASSSKEPAGAAASEFVVLPLLQLLGRLMGSPVSC